jgi:hypothetical protein
MTFELRHVQCLDSLRRCWLVVRFGQCCTWLYHIHWKKHYEKYRNEYDDVEPPEPLAMPLRPLVEGGAANWARNPILLMRNLRFLGHACRSQLEWRWFGKIDTISRDHSSRTISRGRGGPGRWLLHIAQEAQHTTKTAKLSCMGSIGGPMGAPPGHMGRRAGVVSRLRFFGAVIQTGRQARISIIGQRPTPRLHPDRTPGSTVAIKAYAEGVHMPPSKVPWPALSLDEVTMHDQKRGSGASERHT